MAEFCLGCWNKLNEANDNEKRYIISEYLDLCEGCGEYKPVIIMERKAYYMRKFRYLIFPFKVILIILCFACGVLLFPFLIFRYHKLKKKIICNF